MRLSTKTPFSPLSTNRPTQSPVTIFPKQIVFEDVTSNSCYQIDLFIRNQSIDIQKLRIIEPQSKEFKVKVQEGKTKKLAQGLAWKLDVLFCSEKIKGKTVFEDKLIIAGDSFREIVPLKALIPQQTVIIPESFNLGRLLVNHQNLREIPLKNISKRATFIRCECDHNSIVVPMKQLKVQAQSTLKLEVKLKGKKQGNIKTKLKFTNGAQCEVTGAFVDEAIELFGQDGDKLMMIDIGQLFIGEKVQQKIFFMNNSNQQIDSIFKTFNKNIEMSEVKIDPTRGNFIIKSLPEQYAKQLKNSYSCICNEKVKIQPFTEYENKVTIFKKPTKEDIKKFHSYVMGLLEQEIQEQPIIETLIVNVFNFKPSFKIPIKFISVFPRLKVNKTVLDFGQVKERSDACKEVTFFNDGERDILLSTEQPQCVKIEGNPIVKGHHSQTFKICLRAVKAGKIQEVINFKIFDGFVIEVKLFGICRSSSIRAKKICNLNSTRDERNQIKLYETLTSCRENFNKTSGINEQLFNRTDALADARTNKLKRLMKEHIESDSSPKMKEPQLELIHDYSSSKLVFPKKQMTSKACLHKTGKLTVKDIAKLAKTLQIEQLSNVVIKESELSFGNIFIETLVTKTITVVNKNTDPILFEIDTDKTECLKDTNSQIVKIQGRSERQFVINFRPNMLGAIRQPMTYIINRSHIFQIYITAYVTLVNLQVSTKNLELAFSPYDMNFEKTKEVTLFNKGNSLIKCVCKFQDGRHFYTNKQSLEIKPNSQQKVAITYRPVESQEEQNQRMDVDRLTVKVVGGAENIIKCMGLSNDAKIVIKQSEICCMWHIVSVPYNGKLNFKNLSKNETLYRIEIPNELKDIIVFEKEKNILLKEEKKEITYTLVSHNSKRISSSIWVHLRGGKSIKIPVECMFILPSIEVDKRVLDFGHIPIMGNNYQEIITITNEHRSEIKLQMSKKADCEDYLVQIKEVPQFRTQHDIVIETKIKKKTTGFKDQGKQKKNSIHNNGKFIKLPPNVPVQLQIKFVPRKLQNFDIPLPLKLCGTFDHEVLPIPLRLKCTSIEPMVYLFPQKVMFETRIIGEGKSNFLKTFLIKNPHNFKIDWRIQTQQNWKNPSFFLSSTKGCLNPLEESEIEVSFKPQRQGHYWEQLDVILKEKKISHISLQLEGNAIFPSLKFNCNEILMPVVPLKIESRTFLTLQNHGFEAITISKWKTTNTFPMVDISVNFVEGRLLSLAKKNLKVEIICSSQQSISFTTILQFYDEFGTKYEIPLSCTIDNSLMTTYQFLEDQGGNIIYDKKENSVKILPCQWGSFENTQLSTKDLASAQFIKNWLNHQLNLGMKKFPKCFIQSQGELFYRMVTRMAGCQLIKRFESFHQGHFFQNMYAYYLESIRGLKVQGAFLNQIRPEYLLAYKDYKFFIQSKHQVIQSQEIFNVSSFHAWTALFYQLCKLFVLPQVTDKLVSKFAPSSLNLPSSTVYSPPELLIFRFLNSYMSGDLSFNYCDKIKFLEALQYSLEKNLDIKLSNALFTLKVSMVVMTPQIFINLVSKFIWNVLSEYGLNLFLNENDLEVLGAKQMTLFIVSYMSMLYHYVNLSSVSFEASIGDKVTKIIQIDNPVARKAKYKVKIQGSQEFKAEQKQIIINAKSRGEVRVVYHCKQNKDEQAKLLLIPQKEDINSASVQPLAFKLTTSIISKITLKKIQISANLYEVTTLCLEAELPIDITELAEFSVSVNDADEFHPTFYCFQNLSRTLKNNHDKIDLKLVPLSLGYKYCRVIYKSALFGEFNFEIAAKIEPPTVVKQIKLKQLKVNKQEIVQIMLPKENEEFLNAQKYLVDHHCKGGLQLTKRTLNSSKYQISIVESSYISVVEESIQVRKGQLEGRDALGFDLKCLFGKPFAEYSCTLMIKNQQAKDVRYFKLITSVATKPKIVEMQIRSKARQTQCFKIPIKIAPCQFTIQNPCSNVSLTNYQPILRQNTQINAIFSPEWMMHHQMVLTAQNRQTLQQTIYHINLIGQEPLFFDHIKLTGSSVFAKNVKIPLNLNSTEDLQVLIESKRIQIDENAKFTNYRRWVQAKILPSSQQQTCSIKVVKQGSSQYYWAQITITNDKVEQLKQITLEEAPNGQMTYTVPDLVLHANHEIYTESDSYFNYSVQKIATSVSEQNNLGFSFQKAVSPASQLKLCFQFRPYKQMEHLKKIHIMNNNKEYQLQVLCKSPSLPFIMLPEVVSTNMASKTTTINIVNSSDSKGIYKARIQPKGVISLDCCEFELKGKEKKELKMHFNPEFLQLRYKGIIWFESSNLPTYEYHFSAISEFKKVEKTVECQYYSDKNTLKDIYFTNHFQSKQNFTIHTQFKSTPFQLVQPSQPHFSLQSGATKKLIIKVGSQSNIDNINGKLIIKFNQKKWVYNMVSLVIKNMGKKIVWNCQARETYYENIEIPKGIQVKSLESNPQIEPFLTYTTEEGTNALKLKYTPMKPLIRDQYQIFLITDTSKYVINCTVSVSNPPFDDTISIKTKDLNQIGCVSFKLTNTKKQAVPFKAYFLKGLPDLSVELEKNFLESYGRIGTTIYVKFTSNVFNKRVDDELWIETNQMVWRFKVVGMLSKKYNIK